MKRTTLSLLMGLFILTNAFVYGQCDHKHHQNQLKSKNLQFHSCILDEIVKEHVRKNPTVANKYLVFEENQKQLIEQLRNSEKGTDTLINGKRIIPVVFHVIHKYGTENISRQQVEDAIYHLNLDYNRMNADTANTYAHFKSRAADVQIEFRLAKIDPWGNCTDGIARVYDQRTDYAYFNVMRDNSWPYSMYMNVYAVNFIYPEGMVLPQGAIIGGLSPFTPNNPLSPTGGDTLLDGVLVRHDCVGTIGTATSMAGSGINNFNRVMTHETGHFFNLYHPFQNILAMIAGLDNCTHMPIFGINGDEVDDTPPVKQATQGCPTPGSVNSCPTTDIPGYGIEPDMTENFMDYASGQCQNIFTLGQLERVNATLMGTRRKLWSYENLLATGVLDTLPSDCSPKADFTASSTMFCPGYEIDFTDFSYNGTATQWEWIFNGGTPATSTDQTPSITYNTPGTYDVTFIVHNAIGSDTLTKTNYIIVNDDANGILAPHTEGFETASAMNSWVTVDSDPHTSKWIRTNQAASSGNYSLKLNNEDALVGSEDAIISPIFDLSNITTPRLKFKMAYQGKTQSNPLGGGTTELYGELKVQVSTNCGRTWSTRKSIVGSSLSTASTGNNAFVPTTAQWREEVVAALGNLAGNSNVMFRFEYKHLGGNNLYIDDINVVNDNVGLEDNLTAQLSLNIYPNPFTNNAAIDFHLVNQAQVQIEVVDVLGKKVLSLLNKELSEGQHKLMINENNSLKAGMYFVNFTVNDNLVVKRIVMY